MLPGMLPNMFAAPVRYARSVSCTAYPGTAQLGDASVISATEAPPRCAPPLVSCLQPPLRAAACPAACASHHGSSHHPSSLHACCLFKSHDIL